MVGLDELLEGFVLVVAAVDGVDEGVAGVLGLEAVAGVEVDLEGEDNVHLVDEALDGVDAAGVPCPYFWGDVVEYFDAAALEGGGEAEVEAAVVDEDEGVGAPAEDVVVALAEVAADGAEVTEDGEEAHDGGVLVVADDGAPGRLHEVAAPAPALGPGVVAGDALDEVGGMEIARGLAGNDVVFHGTRAFVCFRWREDTNLAGIDDSRGNLSRGSGFFVFSRGRL